MALPPRILSGRIFLGQSPAPREQNLAALSKFSNPQSIHERLSQARDQGYGGLITLGDANVVAAFKTLRAQGGGENGSFDILPVIPNVPGYVREATEHGMAGAGLRRLARVGPLGFLKVGLRGALQAPRVLKKDFPTLLSILYELEMGEFGPLKPPAVFLHHQMTDLALSFGNRALFEAYARIMRTRYKTEPALATSNFALLARRLEEWDIDIQIVAAPLNRENFLMPGGLEAYRPHLESGRFRLIADRLAPKAPTPGEAIDWAAQQPSVESVIAETCLTDDRKKTH